MRETGIDSELEKLADQLLKEDAKQKGYIRPNGRGYTNYAIDHGLITKKHDEKFHKTEMTGLNIEDVERHPGIRYSQRYDDPDDTWER